MAWAHANGEPRGSDAAVALGRDTEGRFGVMFKHLHAFAPPDELLTDLADTMRDPSTSTEPHPELDNPAIPSGFTFFGQFIDHDMTLDTTPLDLQAQDPHAVVNFRTPRFDLDSVYGRGPGMSHELFDPSDPAKLAIAGLGDPTVPDDLPRGPDGKAVAGDGRNDENLIVGQLHVAFLKFHNALVDHVRSQPAGTGSHYARARQLAQWHFQWVIVHDFLPRTVGQDVVDEVLLERDDQPPKVTLEYYKSKNPNRPYMPIEFSGAAYRFGHSQIRPGYRMNDAAGGSIFLDPPSENDLHGSRPVPAKFAIDFKHFFDLPGVGGPPTNVTRRIDAQLSAGLFHLPVPAIVPLQPAPPVVSLAERNLRRGKKLGLPAGQDVAAAMGVRPLTNPEMGLSPNGGWNERAPLWFYVLKEAELQYAGERLGQVGGRIVAEVILGLLKADRDSYFHARPHTFRPKPPIAPAPGQFRMGDLLRFAGAV